MSATDGGQIAANLLDGGSAEFLRFLLERNSAFMAAVQTNPVGRRNKRRVAKLKCRACVGGRGSARNVDAYASSFCEYLNNSNGTFCLNTKMPNIDPVAALKFQPQLLSGESIYWAGMPNPGRIFHSDDWALIPFSLLWGGFAIFWEASVLGYTNFGSKSSAHLASSFMALWGIPFVLCGQYMIWGRFVVDGWLKRRTFYAVTNRRVLLFQEGWKLKKRFIFLESLAELSREGTAIGTLWLGPKLPTIGSRGSRLRGMSRFYFGDSVPVLADIADADQVERLILDLREKSRPMFVQGS